MSIEARLLYTTSGEVLALSPEDRERYDLLPRKPGLEPIAVVCKVRGRPFRVRPASCGAPCYCACEIVPNEEEA